MREEKGWDAWPFQWAASGFRGAVRSGDTTICGALLGGIMVAGLLAGQGLTEAPGPDSRERDLAWKSVQDLFNGFAAKFGDTSCRELTGIDFSSEAGQQRYREQEIYRKCFDYVRYSLEHCLKLDGSLQGLS